LMNWQEVVKWRKFYGVKKARNETSAPNTTRPVP
jgi:hypothetical protein